MGEALTSGIPSMARALGREHGFDQLKQEKRKAQSTMFVSKCGIPGNIYNLSARLYCHAARDVRPSLFDARADTLE